MTNKKTKGRLEIPISDEAKREMNQAVLENWKNSDLVGLKRRSFEISREIQYLEFKQRNLKDEMKVIWYFIAKREAERNE